VGFAGFAAREPALSRGLRRARVCREGDALPVLAGGRFETFPVRGVAGGVGRGCAEGRGRGVGTVPFRRFVGVATVWVRSGVVRRAGTASS